MDTELRSEKGAPPQGIVLPTPARSPFKDIAITGVVLEGRCYLVRGPVLRIFLQLSGAPPLGWSFMFTCVWQTIQYDGKPQAGIEGDAVWVECAPRELRERHLPSLEKSAAQANAFFRPALRQKGVAQQDQKQLDNQARSQLQQLRRSFEESAQPDAPAKKKARSGWIGSFFSAVSAACFKFKRVIRAR